MIGNNILRAFYEYHDLDTSINQIIELLLSKDAEFMVAINEDIDLDICDEKELHFLTILSAIIDYYLQIVNFVIPKWLRDSKLQFQKPYFYSTRINDFDRIKLLFSCSAPFKARNVYFDLEGIKRV